MNKKTRELLRKKNARIRTWKIKHGVPEFDDPDIAPPHMTTSQYRQWFAEQDRYERRRKSSYLSSNPSAEGLAITKDIWAKMKPLGQRGAADWASQHYFLAKRRCDNMSIAYIFGGLVTSMFLASAGYGGLALAVVVIGAFMGVMQKL